MTREGRPEDERPDGEDAPVIITVRQQKTFNIRLQSKVYPDLRKLRLLFSSLEKREVSLAETVERAVACARLARAAGLIEGAADYPEGEEWKWASF